MVGATIIIDIAKYLKNGLMLAILKLRAVFLQSYNSDLNVLQMY